MNHKGQQYFGNRNKLMPYKDISLSYRVSPHAHHILLSQAQNFCLSQVGNTELVSANTGQNLTSHRIPNAACYARMSFKYTVE